MDEPTQSIQPLAVEPVVVGQLQTNCYLLYEPYSRQAVLVDPGAEPERIQRQIERLNLTVTAIVLTHGHFDHIGAVADFSWPVFIHQDDVPRLRSGSKNHSWYVGADIAYAGPVQLLRHADVLTIGRGRARVIHTPGHTPGCVCFFSGNILLSGDTLFRRGIGRTDLPGGSFSQIVTSIQRELFVLPEQTVVYPGHGPQSTIGEEKRENTLS